MFRLDPSPHGINELDDILEEAIKEGTQTNNQGVTFWKIVFAFDIETTSFTGPVTRTDHNEKRSVMYIWQLAINGRVIIGREWAEFIDVMYHITEKLNTDKYNKIIVYVHNLAFEFQFIRFMFPWIKIFSIDKRKPIYAITETGIEFRCSYILTNYSLEKLSDQLTKYKVKKLVGDLDYTKIRHPQTPLTDKELQYCINDVLVVSAYIKEQIEKERYIHKIPLTCTGYCRRFVRKNCLYGPVFKLWRKQFRRYNAFIKSLKIRTIEEYKQLKRAFQGGFTHAAQLYCTYTLDNVAHVDFSSSYPYVLLSEQFPMSTPEDIDCSTLTKEQFDYYLKHYCCLFDCRIYDLKPKFEYENYIAAYKCFLKCGVIENNGRVYKAGMIATTLTEIDMLIINSTYTFSRIEISNLKIYRKGYLPIEIIKSIIELYKNKTMLKGVKGKENEYLVSKGLLNSTYGMMVTDIIRDIITYQDNEWGIEPGDAQEQLDKYNNSRRRFLYYPWGVWCTAYARRNLWYGITNMGKDYIYADTDSIFYNPDPKNEAFINSYNQLCEKKLRRMCDHYGLDYEKELLPKTVKGVVKPIGIFDHEPDIQKFKTLGAKRYMTYIDGELSITVSGVNKKTAIPWLLENCGVDCAFEAFEEGLIVPEDATGKLTHYYIDKPYEGEITDYLGNKYHYFTPSGIYLEKATYCFDITKDYIDFMKGIFYTK